MKITLDLTHDELTVMETYLEIGNEIDDDPDFAVHGQSLLEKFKEAKHGK
jgi:hypothetical protein